MPPNLDSVFLAVAPVLAFIAKRRFRVQPEDVDDLLQDVFVLFLRDWAVVRDPRAWLIGAMSNKCRHYCRIRTRREQREGIASDTAYEPAVEASVVAEGILRRLSARDRIVLHLRFMEGCQVREIAARLGTSRSSADKRLRGALKRARGAATAIPTVEEEPVLRVVMSPSVEQPLLCRVVGLLVFRYFCEKQLDHRVIDNVEQPQPRRRPYRC